MAVRSHKNPWLIYALLVAVTWSPIQAAAAPTTAHDLLRACADFLWAIQKHTIQVEDGTGENLSKVVSGQICVGFLAATQQALKEGLAEPDSCAPEQAETAQLAASYTQYIERRPETWHEPALRHLLQAWRHTFPCAK